MKTDYIKNIDNGERRFYVSPVTVEKRDDDSSEGAVIEGYAALYNSRTDLGWFEEEILPGAFDDVLNDDVRALFNHNSSYVLARTLSGTLTLTADEKGLKYRYSTPNRSYALDLADAIQSGDVSQSSFGFVAEETIWTERNDDKDLRQIKKVSRLYDVSPVTYPAYADTTVAKRSLEEREEENEGLKVVPLSVRQKRLELIKKTK